MNSIRLIGVLILSLVGVLPYSQVVLADEITCRGRLGAVTVDNVRVPQGRTCNLSRTTVQGNVVVGSNATLVATTVRVIGNIQAENARAVTVRANSSIGGSIQVKQSGSASITNSRISQDVQFESNTAQLTATRNIINGNLQVFENTGRILIRTNRINGNLQCKENLIAPRGGGNVVEGSKEDQCARL